MVTTVNGLIAQNIDHVIITLSTRVNYTNWRWEHLNKLHVRDIKSSIDVLVQLLAGYLAGKL